MMIWFQKLRILVSRGLGMLKNPKFSLILYPEHCKLCLMQQYQCFFYLQYQIILEVFNDIQVGMQWIHAARIPTRGQNIS